MLIGHPHSRNRFHSDCLGPLFSFYLMVLQQDAQCTTASPKSHFALTWWLRLWNPDAILRYQLVSRTALCWWCLWRVLSCTQRAPRNNLPQVCEWDVSDSASSQQITSPIQHQQSSRSHESHMIVIAYINTLVSAKVQTTVDHISLWKEGLWRN